MKLSELKTLGKDLLTLGQNLLTSRAHISVTSRPELTPESLQAFFTLLLPHLPSTSKATVSSNSELKYLHSQFDDFVQSLINFAVSSHSDESLREVVLHTIMEFVKIGKGGNFHSAIYHKLLHSIVHSTLVVGDVLIDLLASKYFNYIDVGFFTYISLEKLSQNLDEQNVEGSMEYSVHKIYHLLSKVPPLEGGSVKSDHEMWNGLGIFIKKGNHDDIGSVKAGKKSRKTGTSDENVLSASDISKKMKLKFTKAWISFLGLRLPDDVYKEVLVSLHQDVIPRLTNPIMLCDFLSKSYDFGGVVSVMALSSLFVLMTQHGLEYPDFYVKLYALLEPSVFMEKHRANFFELLDSCLKSPLLPAYLAAAFSKKLSRLALCVPPSGALVIIALIHNLLRRHPSINCLVQREDDETARDASENKKDHSTKNTTSGRNMSGIDHFDNEQTDPVNANAMRSSLWEIDILRHHYCPPVSRFVLSLENDLTVRAKTTEVAVKDFSSGSYATIFNDETRRRVKQVPMAFYKSTPTTLFSESEFTGWSFNFKDGVSNDDKSDARQPEEHNGVSAKRQRVECS